MTPRRGMFEFFRPRQYKVKLFKYIDFKNKYWDQPLRENSLFFSSINEVRGVNDQDEFNHKWDFPSYFFRNKGHFLSESYDRLFSNSRVLCLSKNLDRTCWETFCKTGEGICYEFIYDESKKAKDITCGQIVYDNKKILNVPEYVLGRINNFELRDLLTQERVFSKPELAKMIYWLNNSKQFEEIFTTHIFQELALKKLDSFIFEGEFRFIHIVNSIGPVNPKSKFNNFKLSFETLGLELSHLYTSEIKKVEAIGRNGLKIDKIPF